MTESSGIAVTRATAPASEAKAPPNKATDGMRTAAPANGSNPGANSIAFATRGKTLSLEASKYPRASKSSANTSKGLADVRLKPAFSSFDSNPSWAV